jgi:hypothetical protein
MPTKAQNSDHYGEQAWFYIKICFTLCWIVQIMTMAGTGGECLYPVGICNWYSFDFLFTVPGNWVLVAILLPLFIFYLREQYMLVTTACLSIVSCIIVSRHESSGMLLRATPFTTVFIAQFLAYLFHRLNPHFDLRFYRQQFPVQLIAATYTISAISKLDSSGTGWANAGSTYMALPVLKSFAFEYFDTGHAIALEKGYSIAHFMLTHKSLISSLLTASLLLELCCMLVTLHPFIRFGYGIGLLLMHIGIAISMHILIAGVFFPMLIFFINPVYRLALLAKRLAPFFPEGIRNRLGLQLQ